MIESRKRKGFGKGFGQLGQPGVVKSGVWHAIVSAATSPLIVIQAKKLVERIPQDHWLRSAEVRTALNSLSGGIEGLSDYFGLPGQIAGDRVGAFIEEFTNQLSDKTVQEVSAAIGIPKEILQKLSQGFYESIKDLKDEGALREEAKIFALRLAILKEAFAGSPAEKKEVAARPEINVGKMLSDTGRAIGNAVEALAKDVNPGLRSFRETLAARRQQRLTSRGGR